MAAQQLPQAEENGVGPEGMGLMAGGQRGYQQRSHEGADDAADELCFTVPGVGTDQTHGDGGGQIEVQGDAVQPGEVEVLVAVPASGGAQLEGEAGDKDHHAGDVDHDHQDLPIEPGGQEAQAKQNGGAGHADEGDDLGPELVDVSVHRVSPSIL